MGKTGPAPPSKNVWARTQEFPAQAGFAVLINVINGTPGSPLDTRSILSLGSKLASSARKSPQPAPVRMQLSMAVSDEKSAETPLTTLPTVAPVAASKTFTVLSPSEAP